MSAMTSRKTFFLILSLYTLLTLPLCFLGYGSDNDSYQVIQAGDLTWQHHAWTTSRIPGYWVYEAFVFVLNRAGGSLAVNVASFIMGGLILWRLDRLRKNFPDAAITSASLTLLLIPTFQIAASSTDDYLWSALCLMFAFEALLNDRQLSAGLCSAAAISIRESNLVIVVGLYAAALYLAWKHSAPQLQRSKVSRVALFGALSFLGVLPCYFSYRAACNSLAFLSQGTGNPAWWTFKMHAGRFGYKLIFLLGPLTSAVLVFGFFWFRHNFKVSANDQYAKTLCLGALAANLLLFAVFPLELSYLLPGALFLIILLALSLLRQRSFSVALITAVIISDLASFVFARPNVVNQASDATLTFSMESGPVFHDVRQRLLLLHCSSLTCWKKATGQ